MRGTQVSLPPIPCSVQPRHFVCITSSFEATPKRSSASYLVTSQASIIHHCNSYYLTPWNSLKRQSTPLSPPRPVAVTDIWQNSWVFRCHYINLAVCVCVGGVDSNSTRRMAIGTLRVLWWGPRKLCVASYWGEMSSVCELCPGLPLAQPTPTTKITLVLVRVCPNICNYLPTNGGHFCPLPLTHEKSRFHS